MSATCQKCRKKTSTRCSECDASTCKACLKKVALVSRGESSSRYICLNCVAAIKSSSPASHVAIPRRKISSRTVSSPVLGESRARKLKERALSQTKVGSPEPGIVLVAVHIADCRGDLGKKGKKEAKNLLVKARKSSSSRSIYACVSIGGGGVQTTKAKSGLTIINFNQSLYFPMRARTLQLSSDLKIKITLKEDRSMMMSEDVTIGSGHLPVISKKSKLIPLNMAKDKTLYVSVLITPLQGPWDLLSTADVLGFAASSNLTDEQIPKLMDFLRWYDPIYESGFVLQLLEKEIAETEDSIQLFRVDTRATRCLSRILRAYAPLDFYTDLRVILRDVLKQAGLEMDATRMSSPRDMESEARRLCDVASDIFDCCAKHFPNIDQGVKQVMQPAWSAIKNSFGADAATKAIVGSVFLRWVCPVIISPESNRILRQDELEGHPSARRTFVVLTKLIQSVVNGVEPEKGVFADSSIVAEFITNNQKTVKALDSGLRNAVSSPVFSDNRLTQIVRDGVNSIATVSTLCAEPVNWPECWTNTTAFNLTSSIHPIIGPFCADLEDLLTLVPVKDWGPMEISFFLLSVDLAEYVKLFSDHNVTGETLVLHKSNDILRSTGIAKLGHRKRIALKLDKYLVHGSHQNIYNSI